MFFKAKFPGRPISARAQRSEAEGVSKQKQKKQTKLDTKFMDD